MTSTPSTSAAGGVPPPAPSGRPSGPTAVDLARASGPSVSDAHPARAAAVPSPHQLAQVGHQPSALPGAGRIRRRLTCSNLRGNELSSSNLPGNDSSQHLFAGMGAWAAEASSPEASRSASPINSLRQTLSNFSLSSKASHSKLAAVASAASAASAPETEWEVAAAIQEARQSCSKRGLGEQFDNWLGRQRARPRFDKDTAQELWKAAGTIAAAREEAKRNGTLQQLDVWLGTEESARLDVGTSGIAASLEAAEVTLRSALAHNGTKKETEAIKDFIKSCRRQGKPDILIEAEMLTTDWASKYAKTDWTSRFTYRASDGPRLSATDKTQREIVAKVRKAEFLTALDKRRRAGPPDPNALPSSDGSGDEAPEAAPT